MSVFRCQQFDVHQLHSGMKVCSDSLLFGALARVRGLRVLDLGAGTGLLSLICAQHGAAAVTAVEFDANALKDLKLNFCQSQWSKKLQIFAGKVQEFKSDLQYEWIISNPPFFENSLKSADLSRQRARHTETLPYEDLLVCVAKNLGPQGFFQVLLPKIHSSHFVDLALQSGLSLQRICEVKARENKEAHVHCLFFARSNPPEIVEEKIVIWDENNQYTESSRPLLLDLLLRFMS